MKKLIFISLLLIFSAENIFSQPGSKKIVSTVSAIKSAIQNAVPGDTIEVANGVYNFNGNISITKSGTENYPIIIRAQNRGMAELTGNSYFTCKQTSHVIIEGFLFTSKDVTAVKTESCSYIRITRNIFRLQETSSRKWVLIGGTYNLTEPQSFYNRIDHNLFEEKHQLGNFITIDGSPDPNAKSSQYDRIDHNHFRNIGPRANNEMEAIRVGWSEMSLSSGYTTIEHNLFENCDGDPEIISVKTCDNIIRYNTFKECQGSVALRHGNRNIVEGNFFFGNQKPGTGGVRIYGDDHKIFNNYFEGLTGTNWDAAITINNGDADYPNSSLSKHFRPRRSIFAFNTLVGNDHNIEIGYTNGGAYSKVPVDITIANNVVAGSQNQLVKIISNPQNLLWQRNIMFPSGSATLGVTASSSEIEQVDPVLVNSDGFRRIQSESPAINSSSGLFDFVLTDIEGQQRDGVKDVGADEYSALPPVLHPLTPSDVGPGGGDFTVPVELVSFSGEVFENAVQLKWETASELNNYGFDVERLKDPKIERSEDLPTGQAGWEKIIFIPGKGTTTEAHYYSYIDNDLSDGKYIYRLKQIDFDGTFKYSDEIEISIEKITHYYLGQNYPNPFNPNTNIQYSINSRQFVTLKVFDIVGNEIAVLINEEQELGHYQVNFNSRKLASGIYLYRMQAGDYISQKKMIYLK